MAVTTRDAVIATASELSAVEADDPRWAQYIADAELLMSASAWGSKLEIGARYLVAHWMTRSVKDTSGGTKGPVVSETVGGVSRTYAQPSSSSSSSVYTSTTYGQEYLRLVRVVGAGARAVRSF